MIYNQPVLGVIRNPIYCITVSWAIIEGDVQPKKQPKHNEDWWRHCDLLRNWWLMKIDDMERIRLFFDED